MFSNKMQNILNNLPDFDNKTLKNREYLVHFVLTKSVIQSPVYSRGYLWPTDRQWDGQCNY